MAVITATHHKIKVGLLVSGAFSLVLLFAWMMGSLNPFQRSVDFYVLYNFAGGIEIGSPVRVAGIKVGKVESIEFFPAQELQDTHAKTNSEVLTPLRVKISISKNASESVRQNSKFYINLAGIIGERYVEITPGTKSSPKIENQSVVRGIDPPRLDQLISQSFDLAGKIKEVIEHNEGDIGKSIKILYDLSANINKTFNQLEKSKVLNSNFSVLIGNLIDITTDLKVITSKSQTPEGKKTLDLLYKLLWRLEPLDQHAIQDFFQKEGIKAKLF